MKVSGHSLLGAGVLCLVMASTTSCSRPSAVSPTSPAASSPARVGRNVLTASPADAVAFPLMAGVFEINNGDGDGIVGTYSGIANFPGNTLQESSVTLQVSDGSGAWAGATGTIVATGEGAFADEGGFRLEGRGEVTLAGGKRAVLALSLQGTSSATCSTGGLIAISQTAVGNMRRAGRVVGRLSHEVGNTSCDS